MFPIRTGLGFDVHRLCDGRELWLCGVRLEWHQGLLGHSDADVAIHALCDALLGAAALRDIGYHFPDKDPEYKGIDSKILLHKVCALLRKEGWEIGNADITICAEQPKINPHIPQMQSVLAETMNVEPTDISIKATTTEKLGYTGRQEGVSAYATALIYRHDPSK